MASPINKAPKHYPTLRGNPTNDPFPDVPPSPATKEVLHDLNKAIRDLDPALADPPTPDENRIPQTNLDSPGFIKPKRTFDRQKLDMSLFEKKV